jgi:hypothetical protein
MTMPITFSCGQCGKVYVVSDGLEGKKAACKACGNRMVVPGGEVQPSAEPAPVASRPSSAAARPASSAPRTAPARPDSPPMRFAPESKAKPVPTSEPPVGDVYGFDEAPSALPPIMPRVGGGDESDAPVKKKKKKKGFFASGGKKSSSAGSSFLDGLGALPLRLGAGLAVFAIIGGIGAFGLTSKSEVEAFTRRQLDMTNEMTSILKTVTSVPTAQTASPRLVSLIQRMIANLEGSKDKKASKRDLNAVIQKMKPLQEVALASLMSEFQRLSSIPGAVPALQIEGPMSQLAQVEEQIKTQAARDGLGTN